MQPANTQTKLGTAILKRLLTLKESKGQISIEDVGAMMEGMAETLGGDHSPDRFLRREFERMAQSIVEAKNEVISMMPEDETSPKNITNASNQLDAVIKATEQATNIIMDSADDIQTLVHTNDPKLKEKIDAAVARIYDACNFQDITGQRINKVIGCLETIEAKVTRLVALFSDPTQDVKEVGNDARPDRHLLNGPALPGESPNQAEIDALFANLK